MSLAHQMVQRTLIHCYCRCYDCCPAIAWPDVWWSTNSYISLDVCLLSKWKIAHTQTMRAGAHQQLWRVAKPWIDRPSNLVAFSAFPPPYGLTLHQKRRTFKRLSNLWSGYSCIRQTINKCSSIACASSDHSDYLQLFYYRTLSLTWLLSLFYVNFIGSQLLRMG